MRIIKVVLIILLSLLVAFAIVWAILCYLVWPKPEIARLVPGAPLTLMSASNLEKTLSSAEISGFLNRVARSPLWESLKLSTLGRQIRLQKRAWERQMGPIDLDTIMHLVGKDAILTIYREQGRWDFLLISEVGLLTRINLTSGATKRSLASEYEFAVEEYRGIELVTLTVLDWKFSYGFIGRAGLLSTNKSFLKKVIDLHRNDSRGSTTGAEELVAELSGKNVSFSINASRIRELYSLAEISWLKSYVEAYPYFRYLVSVVEQIDTWAGFGLLEHGDLKLDLQLHHASKPPQKNSASADVPVGTNNSAIGNSSFVPADCMFFLVYSALRADLLFRIPGLFTGVNLDIIGDRLLPVLKNGGAIAILEPKIQELQLLPPVMAFFQVKDRTGAEAALGNLKNSLWIGRRRLEFAEKRYEDAPISYTSLPVGMGMSLNAGYTFIGEHLLVMATDISSLEAAVDVSLGKRESLTKDKKYANIMKPIAVTSDSTPTYGRVFVNIKSAASVTKQAARLYAWRAKIAGDLKTEFLATMLYQNVFVLDAWQYIGSAFDSEDNKTNVRVVLDSD